jgi:type II secretory pathway pseudopilin PulG
MELPTTPGRERPARSSGYTLVALMVGLTVMMILIAAVLPAVSAEMQRMREDELIFRGTQYAEGIRVFRRRYGRYPNALKEMIETRPRTLRKLWKDPMTPDGEWAVIGLTAPVIGVAPPGGPGGGRPTPTPVPTAVPSPFGQSGGGSWGQPGSGGQIGPVTGVYSRSTKKGFRIYQGRENYNDWRFTEQTVFGTPPPLRSPPGPGIVGTTR